MKSVLLKSLALSSVLLLQGCIFGNNTTSSGADTPISIADTSTSNGSLATSSSAKEVQITWQAPSTRLNDEPLSSSDIENYEIVYKQKGETLASSVVAEGTKTDAVITLEPGIVYEVVIAAVDKDGFIGPASSPIEVSI